MAEVRVVVNTRGGFNRPYILFKAKNITDPEVRQQKWKKARPIAPGTRHPMRTLLRIVGRAWYHTTAAWEADHFVLHQTNKVPAFLREAQKLSQHGTLKAIVRDVEGYSPNMPKSAMTGGTEAHCERGIQRQRCGRSVGAQAKYA